VGAPRVGPSSVEALVGAPWEGPSSVEALVSSGLVGAPREDPSCPVWDWSGLVHLLTVPQVRHVTPNHMGAGSDLHRRRGGCSRWVFRHAELWFWVAHVLRPPWASHPTPWASHLTPWASHPTPWASHPTPWASHATPCMYMTPRPCMYMTPRPCMYMTPRWHFRNPGNEGPAGTRRERPAGSFLDLLEPFRFCR